MKMHLIYLLQKLVKFGFVYACLRQPNTLEVSQIKSNASKPKPERGNSVKFTLILDFVDIASKWSNSGRVPLSSSIVIVTGTARDQPISSNG